MNLPRPTVSLVVAALVLPLTGTPVRAYTSRVDYGVMQTFLAPFVSGSKLTKPGPNRTPTPDALLNHATQPNEFKQYAENDDVDPRVPVAIAAVETQCGTDPNAVTCNANNDPWSYFPPSCGGTSCCVAYWLSSGLGRDGSIETIFGYLRTHIDECNTFKLLQKPIAQGGCGYCLGSCLYKLGSKWEPWWQAVGQKFRQLGGNPDTTDLHYFGDHAFGDCNGDGQVTIDEILTAVAIALGDDPPDRCMAVTTPACDTSVMCAGGQPLCGIGAAGSAADQTGSVTVADIIQSVNVALGNYVGDPGCPGPPPPTPTPDLCLDCTCDDCFASGCFDAGGAPCDVCEADYCQPPTPTPDPCDSCGCEDCDSAPCSECDLCSDPIQCPPPTPTPTPTPACTFSVQACDVYNNCRKAAPGVPLPICPCYAIEQEVLVTPANAAGAIVTSIFGSGSCALYCGGSMPQYCPRGHFVAANVIDGFCESPRTYPWTITVYNTENVQICSQQFAVAQGGYNECPTVCSNDYATYEEISCAQQGGWVDFCHHCNLDQGVAYDKCLPPSDALAAMAAPRSALVLWQAEDAVSEETPYDAGAAPGSSGCVWPRGYGGDGPGLGSFIHGLPAAPFARRGR